MDFVIRPFCLLVAGIRMNEEQVKDVKKVGSYENEEACSMCCPFLIDSIVLETEWRK